MLRRLVSFIHLPNLKKEGGESGTAKMDLALFISLQFGLAMNLERVDCPNVENFENKADIFLPKMHTTWYR